MRSCPRAAGRSTLVDAAIIEQVRTDITYLRDLIAGSGDAIALRDALAQLEASAYRIAEAMYAEPTVPGTRAKS